MFICIISLFAEISPSSSYSFFFFNDTATTEIYTLSLHDALPISLSSGRPRQRRQGEFFRSPPSDNPMADARGVDQHGEDRQARLDHPVRIARGNAARSGPDLGSKGAAPRQRPAGPAPGHRRGRERPASARAGGADAGARQDLRRRR